MTGTRQPVEFIPPPSRPVLNDKAARVLVEILRVARERAEADSGDGRPPEGVNRLVARGG